MSLILLRTENADFNLTTLQTVLTSTPSATLDMQCQGYIKLGDGAKDLDGSGGDFEFIITVGGQVVQPSPQTINFDSALRSVVWTTSFPVPVNNTVLLKVKSPNVADADVDMTAYLYDVAPIENALDAAFTDATTLTNNGLKERLRALGWLIRNKMTVLDVNGNTVVYKDNSTTPAFSVNTALTDDSTTTTRLRIQ